MAEYLLLSLKHTHARDPHMTFWAPGSSGYCAHVALAGRYAADEVEANPFHFANGTDVLPLPAEDIADMLAAPRPGYFEKDHGPILPNTRENRERVLAIGQRLIAQREAAAPPPLKSEADGFPLLLRQIAASLLDDGLAPKARSALWLARSSLLATDFYGHRDRAAVAARAARALSTAVPPPSAATGPAPGAA